MTIIKPIEAKNNFRFLILLFVTVFVSGIFYVLEYNSLVNARYQASSLKKQIADATAANADLKNNLYKMTDPVRLDSLAKRASSDPGTETAIYQPIPMGVRFLLLTLIFGVLFGLLGFHLYTLQIQEGDYYFNKVQARSEALAQLQMRRGQLFYGPIGYSHHGCFQQRLPYSLRCAKGGDRFKRDRRSAFVST